MGGVQRPQNRGNGDLADVKHMDDKQVFHQNLIIVLISLAQSKEEQLEYTQPGCTVCDLIEDFDTYANRCYAPEDQSVGQNDAMDELRGMVSRFCDLDLPCFDPSVLDHPDWVKIREVAFRALHAFGYALTPLPRPTLDRDGGWTTKLLEYPLERL
jgi:hypothetical protein